MAQHFIPPLAATPEDLAAHEARTDNPHAVTAAQMGAVAEQKGKWTPAFYSLPGDADARGDTLTPILDFPNAGNYVRQGSFVYVTMQVLRNGWPELGAGGSSGKTLAMMGLPFRPQPTGYFIGDILHSRIFRMVIAGFTFSAQGPHAFFLPPSATTIRQPLKLNDFDENQRFYGGILYQTDED